MSLLTFRDKNFKNQSKSPVWYLEFDALTVEEFSRSAEITQYPVETGATFSDHYQPQPRNISLVGVVSDTPAKPGINIDKKQNAAAPPNMVVRPLDVRKYYKPHEDQITPQGILRPISTTVLPSRRLVRANLDKARRFIPPFVLTLQKTDGGLDSLGRQTPARTTVTRVTSFLQVIDGLMESRTPVTVLLMGGTEYENFFITEHRAPRVSGSSGQIRFELELQEVVLAGAPDIVKPEPEPEEPKHEKKKATGKKGRKAPKGTEISRFQNDVAPLILELSRGL